MAERALKTGVRATCLEVNVPYSQLQHHNPPAQPMRVELGGGEVHIRGYWVHPTKDIQVNVPVLAHEFYPKLEHTPEEVRRNIQLRQVTIPSLQELRKNGYSVDKAIFVSELNVHQRHEKNLNFFRFDLPAILKTVAKREGASLILIANDNPSGKLKRKHVLNLWRDKFTPLLMRGKHFVSGRMNYFIAPSNPEVLMGLRKALNIESIQEGALEEFHPASVRRRIPLRNNYARNYPAIKARNVIIHQQDTVSDDVINELQRMLDQQLAPVIAERTHAPKSVVKDIHSIVGDEEAARELYQRYQQTHSTSQASKDWTKNWLAPKMKNIGRGIAKGALTFGSDVASSYASELYRFVVNATVSALVQTTLDKAIKSVPGKYSDRIKFTPSTIHASIPGGGGTVQLIPKSGVSKISRESVEALRYRVLSALEGRLYPQEIDLLTAFTSVVPSGTSFEIIANTPHIREGMHHIASQLDANGEGHLISQFRLFTEAGLSSILGELNSYLKAELVRIQQGQRDMVFGADF